MFSSIVFNYFLTISCLVGFGYSGYNFSGYGCFENLFFIVLIIDNCNCNIFKEEYKYNYIGQC